jgi:pimeloyl-ACP methyl ester carboxylesterase
MHAHRRGAGLLIITAALVATLGSTVVAQEPSFEQRMSRSDVDAFIVELFEGYEVPRARYDVDVYLLFVETTHPSGVKTPARVQLFVPDTGEAAPRGSYLFAPGSTGLINPCRSSREHEAGIRWGLYRAHVLAFAGQGFVGILPDYMGFEDWNLIQPYFHAESEARLIIDVTTAVDAFLAAGHSPPLVEDGLRGLTRVAAGYSQGGHAIFAAADRNADFPDGLELQGLIGYGPTTSVDALFLEYSSVAPMVVQAYRTIYGDERFPPERILATRWAESLAYDTTRQCVGGMQGYYPREPTELFEPGFMKSLWAETVHLTHPGIHAIMAENRAGLSGHGVPALILQGTNDIVVDRYTQDDFVVALREAGSHVKYLVYQGARHDTRQISFPYATSWIDGLYEPAMKENP